MSSTLYIFPEPRLEALAKAGIVGKDAQTALRAFLAQSMIPNAEQREALRDGSPEKMFAAFGQDTGRVGVVLHKAGLLD
jgi:hypothetical protein